MAEGGVLPGDTHIGSMDMKSWLSLVGVCVGNANSARTFSMKRQSFDPRRRSKGLALWNNMFPLVDLRKTPMTMVPIGLGHPSPGKILPDVEM